MGWVEVELEPLVPGAEVVDLEAPMTCIALVAKLSWDLVATDAFKSSTGSVGPLYDDGLDVRLRTVLFDRRPLFLLLWTYSSCLSPGNTGISSSEIHSDQESAIRGIIRIIHAQSRHICCRFLHDEDVLIAR